MPFDQEIMFAHFEEPVPVHALKDDVAGSGPGRIDAISGADLNAALTVGKLKSKGAAKLLEKLHEALPGVSYPLALVVWIGAIRRHPDHEDKSPRVILDEVMKGAIAPESFLPVSVQ